MSRPARVCGASAAPAWWRRLQRPVIVAVALLLTGLTAGPLQAQQERLTVERIERSVVRVIALTPDASGQLQPIGSASGVVINDRGDVVTNQHVVARQATQALQVIASGESAPVAVEAVVWADGGRDLALLRLARAVGEPARLTQAVPGKGEAVLAIGYPGVADHLDAVGSVRFAGDATLTAGIVSRVFVGQWIRHPDAPRVHVLQHTADVNPGNSGGPLFDACGRVVGINTARPLSQLSADPGPGGQASAYAPAPGINWASQIVELTTELDARGIAYRADDQACAPAPPSTGSVPLLGLSALALLIAGVALWRSYGRRRPSIPTPQLAALTLSGRLADGSGLRIDLGGDMLERDGGLIVGRQPDLCDLRLDDNRVSRRHARLFIRYSELFIEDLEASNPTELNGRRLKPYRPHPLRCGDRLRIGATELTVSRK